MARPDEQRLSEGKVHGSLAKQHLSLKGRNMSKRDIFLMVMLVYLSGHTLLTHVPYTDFIFVSYSVFLVFLAAHSVRPVMTHKMVKLFVAFSIIFAMQFALGIPLKVVTIFGFFMKLTIAFLTVRLVDDFLQKLVQVMYWLAIISLGFWALQYAAPSLARPIAEAFRPINESLGIHREVNFLIHQYDFDPNLGYRQMANFAVPRNSGPFYEPGPFSGWLLLSLIALGLRQDAFTRKQFWRLLNVLSFCIVTTVSTMGLGLLPLAYFYCFLKRRKVELPGRLAGIVVFCVLVYGIAWSGAVQERLVGDIRNSLEQSAGWTQLRTAGMLMLISQIRERPFVGWGLHNEYRFEHYNVGADDYGNGLGMIIVRFGLTGFFLIILTFCDSYRQYAKNFWEIPYLMIVTLAMIGGNAPYMSPVFLCFWVLPARANAFFNIRRSTKVKRRE